LDHVERTLLSAGFDVAVDLDIDWEAHQKEANLRPVENFVQTLSMSFSA
jgi:hypothetical protein